MRLVESLVIPPIGFAELSEKINKYGSVGEDNERTDIFALCCSFSLENDAARLGGAT